MFDRLVAESDSPLNMFLLMCMHTQPDLMLELGMKSLIANDLRLFDKASVLSSGFKALCSEQIEAIVDKLPESAFSEANIKYLAECTSPSFWLRHKKIIKGHKESAGEVLLLSYITRIQGSQPTGADDVPLYLLSRIFHPQLDQKDKDELIQYLNWKDF